MTNGIAGPLTLFGKRLVIVYFVLYFLPFPFTVLARLDQLVMPAWLQGMSALVSYFSAGSEALAVWVGERVLDLGKGAVIIQPTGSGDTLAQYLNALCILVLALAGAIGWSIARGRQPISPRVVEGFRVFMRYALAVDLLNYGFAKVPPLQFQPPGDDLLLRTYGDSSPMGLLWTFMGFSPAYTMFAGVAEIIPGLLLLWRPTATLGALTGAATMLNVVALNFCYDVPVKLFSSHLLAALITIAAPDLPRLFRLFVLNRATDAAPVRVLSARQNLVRLAAKTAYLLLFLGTTVWSAYTGWDSTYLRPAPMPALAGVYDVTSFGMRDGTDGVAAGSRWMRLAIGRARATVQWTGGGHDRFIWRLNDTGDALTLTRLGSTTSYVMTLRQPSANQLVLEGTFQDQPIRVELSRAQDRRFPIATRGFHWIQEQPFNR